MEKIFLDANIVIDIVEKRSELTLTSLSGCKVYISPLSLHILLYIYKRSIPDSLLNELISEINICSFTEDITKYALLGPSTDFEDNVQLHSAAQSECDCFLTRDKDLLNMKFFGKVKIVEKL